MSTSTTTTPATSGTGSGWHPSDVVLRTMASLLALAHAHGRRRRPDDGQATAEYALVLLGAAAIALLVVSWATKTNVVGRLLDLVFGQLTSRATTKGG